MTSDHAAVDRRIDLVALRERLEDNAFLFEDPDTYNAGVADALEVVSRELRRAGRQELVRVND